MSEPGTRFLPSSPHRSSRYELIPLSLHDAKEANQTFYTRLAQDIHTAQKSVDLRFFMAQYDEHTRLVFDELRDAARRGAARPGVVVRFHIDTPRAEILVPNLAILSTLWEVHRLNRLARKENLPLEIRFGTKDPGIRNSIKHNHEKYAVIDAGEITARSYIGSSNIAGHFINWHDYMVRTTDAETASALADDFQKAWEKGKKEGFGHYKVDANTQTEIIADSKETHEIIDRVIAEIENAQETVFLETTYMDRGRVQEALIRAKQRGVDVQVLLPAPSSSNDFRYRFRPKLWLKPLVDAGIPVYLHGKSHKAFSHSKILLIDNLAIIGSSNFTEDSLEGGNAEIALLSRDPELYELLQQWYLDGREEAQRYTGEPKKRRG